MAKKEETKNIKPSFAKATEGKEESYSEEMGFTIKDGFKFGFGFFLAGMLVTVLIAITVIIIAWILKVSGISLYR